MKKIICAFLSAACLMVSGCSAVSEDVYREMMDNNYNLSHDNSNLKSEVERLTAENSEQQSKIAELESQLSELTHNEEYNQFIKLTEKQKVIELAKSETDKMNAEAEKMEAEARLKLAKEEFTQAEAEEQRRLTDGVLIYEDDYVKICYMSTGRAMYGTEEYVNFAVENKTDGVLTFQAECIAINGVDLGYVSMSDDISPQSKGRIRGRVDVSIPEVPNTITGQLIVIDFDEKVFATDFTSLSYDVDFINVVI